MTSPAGDGVPRLHSAVAHHGVADVRSHDHPHHELIVVRTGTLDTRTAGRELRLRAGSLQVIPAGVGHDQRCHGLWRTSCVLFDDPHLRRRDAPIVLDGCPPMVLRWTDDLLGAFDRGQATIAEALLRAVLAWVGQAVDVQAAADDLPPAVARALTLIEAAPRADPDIAALARAAGVSPGRLRVLFQRYFGCGPLRFIHRQRLESAARLLLDPYLPVGEIGRRCGYPDANYFARRFAAELGCSPRAFRVRSLRHR